jgi:transcriptional regulator with XRE-family HTH domain
MITPMQARAARAALRWSGPTMAKRAGVGVNTVVRFERGHAFMSTTVEAMEKALAAAGVEFIGQTGINLKRPPKD